jgi:hypothetical protein
MATPDTQLSGGRFSAWTVAGNSGVFAARGAIEPTGQVLVYDLDSCALLGTADVTSLVTMIITVSPDDRVTFESGASLVPFSGDWAIDFTDYFYDAVIQQIETGPSYHLEAIAYLWQGWMAAYEPWVQPPWKIWTALH